MAVKPWALHLLGLGAVTVLALVALGVILGRRSARDLSLVYAWVVLVPMVVWLLPPVVGALAKGALRLHQVLKGAAGFYVQLPSPGPARFPRTLAMALGPFSLNLLLLAQVIYLRGLGDLRSLRTGLIAFPTLLVLVGILTSLPPGVWLLDALGLRFVDLRAGSILPVSELYQRYLGPLGALAALGSFIILLHTAGYSYEVGLLLLFAWMATLFPPILAATCLYRLVVEPRALPGLQRWCGGQGIGLVRSLEEAAARPGPVAKPAGVPGGGGLRGRR